MLKKADLGKTSREYWRTEVDGIRADLTHGSMYLAEEALNIIERFIEKQLYNNRTELFQSFSKLVNALVRAKPLMALIFTHSHRILKFIEAIPKDERNIRKVKKLVLQEILTIRQEAATREKAIVKLGSRMILEQHTILTHSSSRIVEAVIMEAKRLKKHFRVICTESRPLLEGSEMAVRLAKAGIKTRLIPDADLTRIMPEVNFILTGVDRITETSYINKTGTFNAAIIAREKDTPFYMAADTAKILPKRVYPAKFTSTSEKDIWTRKHANLTVENFIFEEIPLTYVNKIVCETGIFETEEFIKRYLTF